MTKFYLMGGFGNLCFQKLTTMELAKRSHLKIDESLISQNFLTRNILRWNIHQNLSDILFANTFNTYDDKKLLVYLDLVLLFMSKIFKKVIFGRVWLQGTLHTCEGVKVIAGYCQEKVLFNECRNNIPKLSELVREKFLSEKVGLVIHYRGTDSVWAKGNNMFYKEIISKHVGNMKPIVVTDDIVRASKVFENNESLVSGTLISDFSLMINSSCLVVAPSTLSWWAGVLSVHAEIIYIPSILLDKLPDLSFDRRVIYV